MSKRVAGNQLTHDNWDDEEEAEEAGVFKRASEDTMKQRKIKTAKRRGVSFQSEGEGSGAFSGFKGFSGFGANGSSSALSGFSALKSKPTSSVSNGTTTAAASSTSKIPDFKFEPKKQPATETSKQTDSSNADKSKYFTQLKGLNENVAAWIKKHVDSNPYCILTPIFKDYEKHLAGIEKLNSDMCEQPGTAAKVEPKLDSNVTSSGGFKPASISSSTTEGAPVFKFAVTSSDKEAKQYAATSSSDSTKKEPESSTSGFTFATSGTTFTASGSSSTSSGFQFGTSSTTGGLKPFSFAMGSTSADSNNAPATSQGVSGDDDEYVPPKPEVKEVKEDAIYSKRCKLFFQKETAEGGKEWAEKGIGNLHLKETEGGKTQLLIRADTNLGNVLLNILLTDSIPLSRQGKNNVNMMCIPSPPVDPKMDTSKPIMMLIRVKTSDDADELYEKMTELKKGK